MSNLDAWSFFVGAASMLGLEIIGVFLLTALANWWYPR